MQMYKNPKICRVCGGKFNSNIPQKVYCSDSCKHAQYKNIGGNNAGIPSGTVGAASELIIAGYLLNKGWAVFRSVSPSCFCDLIAVKDGVTHYIECRTAYKHPTYNTLYYPKNKHADADIFGLLITGTNEVEFWDEKDNCLEL